MKKILIGFLVVCLFVSTTACDNKGLSNTSEDNAKKGVTNIRKLDISPEDTRDPLGINGNYFYYITNIDNYNDTANATFWQYNLTTGEKKKMGSIENYSISSGTKAFVGEEKLFATYGLVEDGNNNAHVMFDLKECKMTVLAKDEFFPPLVYSLPVNESQFLEFQPKQIHDDGYEYQIRIGDKDGNLQTIITKQRFKNQKGEAISDVCVYANTIYTFEYRGKDRCICSYDLNGNEISSETSDVLNEFLDTPNEYNGEPETLDSIIVINGYYFFGTMNGKKLVLHKSNGEYSKVENLSMGNIGIVSNTDSLDESDEKVIMFDYDKKELLYFDVNKGEFNSLGILLKDTTYLTTDGKKLIYIDEKDHQLYYINDVFAS